MIYMDEANWETTLLTHVQHGDSDAMHRLDKHAV